jgi:hypothetical protein
MRRPFIIIMTLGLIMIINISNLALAATTFTQTVTINVAVINELSVSGNPAAMIVNLANAGSQPTGIFNAVTSYNISSNDSNKKITGRLSSAMPANTSLKINLAPPTGAVSMGDVTLTTVASDLVTGINKVAESGKTITYTFSANVAAGVITAKTRTVTLTITN